MTEPHIDTEEGQLLHRRRVMLEKWGSRPAPSLLEVRIASVEYIHALETFIKNHYRTGWLRNDEGLHTWRHECYKVSLWGEER